MNMYELLVAQRFYYEMYEFSGNPEWLQYAEDCGHDIDVMEARF